MEFFDINTKTGVVCGIYTDSLDQAMKLAGGDCQGHAHYRINDNKTAWELVESVGMPV